MLSSTNFFVMCSFLREWGNTMMLNRVFDDRLVFMREKNGVTKLQKELCLSFEGVYFS